MNSSSRKRERAEGLTPPLEVIEAVRKLVKAEGEKAVAIKLNVGRSTVTRLRGGLPCRAGTIELARHRLGLAS